MKRIVLVALIVLSLVVIAYAVDTFWDSGIDTKVHGTRTWTDGDFPKWIIGTAADTSEQIDVHMFTTFATCWEIDVCQTGDSGVVLFGFQLSVDGSNWYTYETKTFADDDTAFQFHKWTLSPALYGRMVITGTQGANDSAYVKTYKTIMQQ